MIIINKSKYLKYENLKFKCSVGKAGIGFKKKEGDNITPIGSYKIIKIFYRKDRIKKIKSNIKLIHIKKILAGAMTQKVKITINKLKLQI